jgi:hypothetical protein
LQQKETPRPHRKRKPNYHQGPRHFKRSESHMKSLRKTICEVWKTKLYSDVDVYCAEDSGMVKTHRLVLAALSPFLRDVLASQDPYCNGESCLIYLQDVSSSVLADFLGRVCGGEDELAEVDPSLEFLGFGGLGLILEMSEQASTRIKVEPEFYGEYEPEPDPDFWAADDFGGNNDNNKEDEEDTSSANVDKHYLQTANVDFQRRIANDVDFQRRIAWNCFEPLDKTMAKCTMCTTMVKTVQGCTSSMLNHLRRDHPKLSGLLEEDSEEEQWNKDSSPDMEEPLKRKHSKTKAMVAVKSSRDRSPHLDKGLQRRSLAWNYFQPVDKEVAMCSACRGLIKTDNGTGTMLNHLRRTHPDLHSQLKKECDEQQQRVPDSIPEVEPDSELRKNEMSEEAVRSSPVWRFFKLDPEDENQIRCGTCEKVGWVRICRLGWDRLGQVSSG